MASCKIVRITHSRIGILITYSLTRLYLLLFIFYLEIMDEALEILWTYARREPLDSNGETVVPTINNSIAAIRIIMRLEGWGSEKRKIKSSENLKLGHVGEKWATRDCRGKVRESGVCEQFVLCIFVIVFVRFGVVIIVIIVYVRFGELRLGGMGLGELLADFTPTITCWFIRDCSLFTSHSPSF